MEITLLQRNIVWADPIANRTAAEQALARCPKSDLLVLPEMFSTGFYMQPHGVAETDKATLHWMQHIATTRQCAIAGSVATEEDGKFYNRCYFVHPDGRTEHYDKRHLFSYANENRYYTPGTERVIVRHNGVRILLAVCYDLRFPVWTRNRGDYDLILYVANWPATRIEAWNTLLRARAIENQCYVAGVNRVGCDPKCIYPGGSTVIDPYGRTLIACMPGQEDEVTATIDLEELEHFRQKFPVLNDAD